jgi:hypothetical protein
MSGLVQLLIEVKVAKTLPSMVTKHAILTTLMNKSYTSSLKHKPWVLNVHPRNVTMVICHKESMQNIKEISLVIVNIEKEEGHVGSWDEGNYAIMVGS